MPHGTQGIGKQYKQTLKHSSKKKEYEPGRISKAGVKRKLSAGAKKVGGAILKGSEKFDKAMSKHKWTIASLAAGGPVGVGIKTGVGMAAAKLGGKALVKKGAAKLGAKLTKSGGKALPSSAKRALQEPALAVKQFVRPPYPTGVTMRMRSLGTEIDLRKIAMERLQRAERAQVAMKLLKPVPQTRRR